MPRDDGSIAILILVIPSYVEFWYVVDDFYIR